MSIPKKYNLFFSAISDFNWISLLCREWNRKEYSIGYMFTHTNTKSSNVSSWNCSLFSPHLQRTLEILCNVSWSMNFTNTVKNLLTHNCFEKLCTRLTRQSYHVMRVAGGLPNSKSFPWTDILGGRFQPASFSGLIVSGLGAKVDPPLP